MKKNRTGICTFYRNTDEDAGEHCREAATQGLWRGFWYRSYCTKRYFRGSLYLLQCQGNLLDCTADRKTDTYTVVKAKDYIRKPKKMGMRVTISFWISRCLTKERQLWFVWNCSCGRWSWMRGQEWITGFLTKRSSAGNGTPHWKYARIGRRLDKLIQKTLDDSKTV